MAQLVSLISVVWRVPVARSTVIAAVRLVIGTRWMIPPEESGRLISWVYWNVNRALRARASA